MSAFSNARWVGTIQVTRVGVQLLSLLILSRLLSPSDFGLVAMALTITNFAMLVRDLGTGAAIVQSALLDPKTTLTAHWSNCLIGMGLGLLLLLLSVPASIFFQTPAVQPILQLLALSFPILGASTIHQALLERSSRFALLARIEISAVISGFIVAVVAAFFGMGAYSLVLQTLTTVTISAVQLWIASDLKSQWFWGREQALALWKFSGHLLGFNVVNYFARNADSAIIGRVLGPTALGPYAVAYRLMLFPLQNLTFVAARALLPVMSRSQDEVSEVGSMYLRTLSVIAFFTAPLMAGLFVLREPFVGVVLGDAWQVVAVLTAWLAPVGFIQSLGSVGGTVLTAVGRTDALFKLGIFGTTIAVIAFVVGVRWGVVGVAAAYFAATLINATASFQVLLKILRQPASTLAIAVLPAIVRALIMGTAMHFAQRELESQGVTQGVRLVLLSVGGALIYLALTRVNARPSDRDVLRLFMRGA
jgi:O-antigen/teichoic acid export membrane protein